MKIAELMNKVDVFRPNQVRDGIKRGWLSEIEMLLINEVVLTHEVPERIRNHETYIKFMENGGVGNVYDEESTGELIAQAPYDDLYFWWIMSKLDLMERNTEQYINDSQMYNNAYLTYKQWYNRNHMPVTQTKSFLRGSRKEGCHVSFGTESNG